ncbi:PREDICTED: transmembrane protein 26-like, partial [Vollenhovia emeryi]|uniref:transmembrane protein 26-like n=1 Tax=Vollenhovia emeryi TaxID=411798 RepID=UPI0005F542F8
MVKSATIKGIIIRLVFLFHGYVITWQLGVSFIIPVNLSEYPWNLSSATNLLLFFEGIYTYKIKKSQTWKWFQPSVILYLLSVLPTIWYLEGMKAFSIENKSESCRREAERRQDLCDLINPNNPSPNMPIILYYIIRAHCFDVDTRDYLEHADIELNDIIGSYIHTQFLMLNLVINQWMLNSDLTRDQLSQLLLFYIGTAAEIMNVFSLASERIIMLFGYMMIVPLIMCTWSLVQFTVAPTVTKSKKSRLLSGNTARQKVQTETNENSIDLRRLFLGNKNIIFQDGPFLVFRIIMITNFGFVSNMTIMYTLKNVIVILQQLCHYYVLYMEKRNLNKQCSKMDVSNISIISQGDMYRDIRMRNVRYINRPKNQRVKDVVANNSAIGDLNKINSLPKNVVPSKR